MAGNRNFYEILGISPTAEPQEIRAAFRRLAIERHPDRFQSDLRRAAEADFQEITEAYNVLVDPSQRSRYDQTLGSGTRDVPTNPKDVARALLAKGAEVLRSGDVGRAAELMQQALAHDPQNPRAHHLYGLLLTQHTPRHADGLRHLDQAVRLDGMNVRVLLDASRQFAKARMFAKAQRLAQNASELSPGDPAVENWILQLAGITQQEMR